MLIVSIKIIRLSFDGIVMAEENNNNPQRRILEFLHEQALERPLTELDVTQIATGTNLPIDEVRRQVNEAVINNLVEADHFSDDGIPTVRINMHGEERLRDLREHENRPEFGEPPPVRLTQGEKTVDFFKRHKIFVIVIIPLIIGALFFFLQFVIPPLYIHDNSFKPEIEMSVSDRIVLGMGVGELNPNVTINVKGNVPHNGDLIINIENYSLSGKYYDQSLFQTNSMHFRGDNKIPVEGKVQESITLQLVPDTSYFPQYAGRDPHVYLETQFGSITLRADYNDLVTNHTKSFFKTTELYGQIMGCPDNEHFICNK